MSDDTFYRIDLVQQGVFGEAMRQAAASNQADGYITDEYLQQLLDEMATYKRLYGANWASFVDPMVAARINTSIDMWYGQRTRPKEGGAPDEREYIQDEPMAQHLEAAFRQPEPELPPTIENFKVGNKLGCSMPKTGKTGAKIDFVLGGKAGTAKTAGRVVFGDVRFSQDDIRDNAVAIIESLVNTSNRLRSSDIADSNPLEVDKTSLSNINVISYDFSERQPRFVLFTDPRQEVTPTGNEEEPLYVTEISAKLELLKKGPSRGWSAENWAEYIQGDIETILGNEMQGGKSIKAIFNPRDISTGEGTYKFDARSGVAQGLARNLAAGNIDIHSVARLMQQASEESGQTYSPASAALYALAFADAQGSENWVIWEDENGVPIIYFGSDGVFSLYGNVPGGGNCMTFASMTLLGGGAEPSVNWGLGRFDTRHTATEGEFEGVYHSRNIGIGERFAPPEHAEYFAGITIPTDDSNPFEGPRPFTGVADFNTFLYGGVEISPNIEVTFHWRYNYEITDSIENKQNAFDNLGVGDLIISKDTDPSNAKDHVAVVVGWGPPEGGGWKPPDPENGVVTEFYPTTEDAPEGVDTSNWVPYIVDHGGNNPCHYPRPWTQGVTTDQVMPQAAPEVDISFVNIEPK